MPFGLSASGSSGSNESFISPEQLPFLMNLWGQGQNAVGGAQQGIQQALPGLQNNVVNPALSAFQQIVSGGGGNPFLEQNIQNQNESLGQTFNESILPGLRRGATATGGFGASSGARNQLAEGVAGRGLLQAQQGGESQLRGDAFTQQLMAMVQAMGMGGNMFNLGLSPSMAAFAPLQAQSGILGNPAILGKGSQEAQSIGLDPVRGIA